MRVFMVVFNPAYQPRQALLDFLDTRREVLNWFAFLPAGVFVVSRMDAHELSVLIHEKFPATYLLVSEVNPETTNGWQSANAWDFINKPKSSGRWE